MKEKNLLFFVHSTVVRDIERLAPAHPRCQSLQTTGDLMSLVWTYSRLDFWSPIPYLHVMNNNTQGKILQQLQALPNFLPNSLENAR